MVEAVRNRRDFSALSRSRTRARSGPLWVVRADAPSHGTHSPLDVPSTSADQPATGDEPVQVAYAIGKPVGGAVVRNRVRRRLRVLVTDLERRRALRPGVYLVGAQPAAAEAPFEDLAGHLERAVAELR